MKKINPNDSIHTSSSIMPVIYGAEIPYDIRYKDGWLKIGEARKQIADTRLSQEGHEIDADLKKIWERNALYEGNPIEFFRDIDFHKYLKNNGIDCAKRNSSGRDMEVFNISADDALKMLDEFRVNRGKVEYDFAVADYILRTEQVNACNMTYEYYKTHPNGEFLWNAKPRFGKTLTTYDFAKRIKAQRILIVTNRPVISTSWYSDYVSFVGVSIPDGYFFVSGTSSLKNKPLVMTYDEYVKDANARGKALPMIYFVSLQDIKGSKYFSSNGTDKLRELSTLSWDLLVIDEAHEGVDTYKTDVAFNHIKRKFTLHLSGTPFKALANDKFSSDAIFNWTYADEQKMKAENAHLADSPYAELPTLNMYVYKMSDMITDKLRRGVDLSDESGNYSFDLCDFFRTRTPENGTPYFVENSSVDEFLNALTTNEKYPFSTEKLRNELKHTLWLLDRVDSCIALKRKLENHPVFKDYKIIPAVGNEVSNAYDAVRKAIDENDKTITLSVGQLTAGVTIPEWTAVLMLSNVSSPSLYMQTAFRAQNPYTYKVPNENGDGFDIRCKENAYVFDFDPARTLTVFEKFANNLKLDTVNGGGTIEQRQNNIKELLNFFPVIGEDEDGTLVELSVEQILTIPRKIRSQEVVRRGFMSNFLFNISNVFNLPKPVMDVINTFDPAKEEKRKTSTDIVISASSGFAVDDEGNVTATDEHTDEVVSEIFGDKKYADVTPEDAEDIAEEISTPDRNTEATNKIASILEQTAQKIVSDAQEQYGENMKKSDVNQLTSHFKSQADKTAYGITEDYLIKQNTLEKEKEEALAQAVESVDGSDMTTEEYTKVVEDKQKAVLVEYEQKKDDLQSDLAQQIADAVNSFEKKSETTTAKVMEEKTEQRRATNLMEDVRERLRGFARTIPSFIMAYSSDADGNPTNLSLANFDKIVDDDVFKDVTSITLEQFRQLRDGFDYEDEDGNKKHFDGNMFDQVVFDDSVNEFINLKDKLANYFDESSFVMVDGDKIEDIFDLIPPQKTNQIYTPKNVVKEMADYLEQENPDCFDNPDATFIDLYMKSGLYITEIVKRLYRSPKLIEQFPDDTERLQHIFDKQVYGLAPSPIIYRIATNYILGFAKLQGLKINTSHFVELDALPYAQGQKAQTLEEKLDELFGEDE